jgi:hypothetical protein
MQRSMGNRAVAGVVRRKPDPERRLMRDQRVTFAQAASSRISQRRAAAMSRSLRARRRADAIEVAVIPHR